MRQPLILKELCQVLQKKKSIILKRTQITKIPITQLLYVFILP